MSASAAETLLQPHQEEKSCENPTGNGNKALNTAEIVKNFNNNKTTSGAGGCSDLEANSVASKLTSDSKQNLASTEALAASGNTAAATYARNLLLVHK